MKVVSIRQKPEATRSLKVVAANQKSIDALPFDSGAWNVEGVPGLYVRCQVKTKTFRLERRVFGELVKQTLLATTLKDAKAEAAKTWTKMKPPTTSGGVTLSIAVEAYIQNRLSMKKMAPITEKLARYNLTKYLDHWKDRTLERIGADRPGIAALHQMLTAKHGPATCNQVMRLVAAVYRWSKDRTHLDLPDWPRKVAEIHVIPARDWAYSPDELRAWWSATEKPKGGKEVQKGVSTLGPIKRAWWLTALLTGARKGSIEALRWTDVDLSKRVIRFSVTKGDRPYSVPMSDTLAELLAQYQGSPDVPPSQWVFPSPVIDGGHLVDVKNPNEGVGPAHRLRHTFRTTLAELGASPDQARMLMGHSMAGDVSRGYISAPLVVESLRPVTNAVSAHYTRVLGSLV
ncbi:MAG: tyrosine-type recombinase/integrase [Bryobacteraceae bacterium]